MYTGDGFHRRLRVESIFDAITLLRNGEKMRVSHHVERVALIVRGHAMPDREIVDRIDDGDYHDDGDRQLLQTEAHSAGWMSKSDRPFRDFSSEVEQSPVIAR